jgi:DNA polymerase III delta subunit
LQPPVFFKRKPNFTKQLRTHPPAKLARLMNDVLTLEGKMKSSGVPEAVLPQTILSLCARNGKMAA